MPNVFMVLNWIVFESVGFNLKFLKTWYSTYIYNEGEITLLVFEDCPVSKIGLSSFKWAFLFPQI